MMVNSSAKPADTFLHDESIQVRFADSDTTNSRNMNNNSRMEPSATEMEAVQMLGDLLQEEDKMYYDEAYTTNFPQN